MKRKDIENLGRQMMNLLESQFFEDCELILYDFSGGAASIVEYCNNRQCRMACLPDQTPESIAQRANGGDVFNEIRMASGGHVIKTSIIFFHEDSGSLCGALCLNHDITELVNFNRLLGAFSGARNSSTESEAACHPQDVAGFLDCLIREAQRYVGKKPSDLNKDERFSFLEYLDSHGAFQISKSSVIISDLLGISKFTLYSDLDRIRIRTSD
ncbi:MAG: helix-turn-helix domain-containing protein [Sphaerochaetaceae bacterium]